jgi:hypothetical protein
MKDIASGDRTMSAVSRMTTSDNHTDGFFKRAVWKTDKSLPQSKEVFNPS